MSKVGFAWASVIRRVFTSGFFVSYGLDKSSTSVLKPDIQISVPTLDNPARVKANVPPEEPAYYAVSYRKDHPVLHITLEEDFEAPLRKVELKESRFNNFLKEPGSFGNPFLEPISAESPVAYIHQSTGAGMYYAANNLFHYRTHASQDNIRAGIQDLADNSFTLAPGLMKKRIMKFSMRDLDSLTEGLFATRVMSSTHPFPETENLVLGVGK